MRHYLYIVIFIALVLPFSGCSTQTADDTPTAEDSIRYDRAIKLQLQDNIREAAAELDTFLSTPRPHTSRMDMNAINNLAWCRLCDKRQEEAMQLVLKGDSIAHAMKDEFMQAVFRFANGRYIVDDNNKMGIDYMKDGISLMKQFMENTNDPKEQHVCSKKIINYYENLLWAMWNEPTEEKRRTVNELETFMNNCLAQKTITQQEYEEELFQLYSDKMNIFIEEGEMEKAKEMFQLCQETPTAMTSHGRANLPAMLMSLGRLEEAIVLLEEDRQVYLESGDTLELNENYCSLIACLAECYDSLHQEDKARYFKSEYERISNAITIHHANQDIAHLGTLYEVQQRQYLVEEEHQRSLLTTIISIALAILLIIAVAGIIYSRHINNIIRKKNVVLANHINHLIDEARNTETETAPTDKSEKKTVNDEAAVLLIQKFKHEFISRKLFCDANFDRDALLDELGISRRAFPQQFEAYTGATIAQFTLNTRLEYAAELIRNHPDHTIDSIAQDSGFSGRSTFYRNFTRQFGITPTEYRAQCQS